MPLELKKVQAVELRSIGLDEKWLQSQLMEDTTILGLGELEVLSRERRQPLGGKIDFLMYSQESTTYYEVEVMLGTLDESHIIRTIEYWDIERQRRPGAEHRAVIVAEKITSRFFNVLRLLNRSVPMIAVQLEAFKIDESSIVLHAVTVLDVTEETPEAYVAEEAEETDRRYWEQKRDGASLAVMDKILASLKSTLVSQRISYNKHHIALGSTGNNFCWFHPRKTVGFCHLEFKLTPETRDDQLSTLQKAGIDASARSTDRVSFSISNKTVDERLSSIVEALRQAEALSR
ncbi:hypothetical protein [Bradyrhizobium oligotrophicum]|uniref:hypothetical protein n=1 Tax=Bradyrhizobium oligotrophicum TaxID=44255 RepID=UPI003EC0899C